MPATNSPRLASLAGVLTALAAAVAILGFGPRDWWLCDLLANLRGHVLLSFVVLIPVLVVLRLRRLAGVSGVAVLAVVMLSFQPFAGTAAQGQADSEALSIMSFNLSATLRSPDGIRRYLEDTAADIVILQEYTPEWHAELAVLSERFPYTVVEPQTGYFGIAMFSRVPLAGAEALPFPGTDMPYIAATAMIDERPLALIGLHLDWPMTPSSFARRNQQMDYLLANMPTSAFVACGDWNMTPWSAWYRRLKASGLHDGDPGNRLLATWPTRLGWLGIAIDHCFASSDVHIVSKRVGPRLDSDHRPILVGISLR